MQGIINLLSVRTMLRLFWKALIIISISSLALSCSSATDPDDPDPCNPNTPDIVDFQAGPGNQLMINGDPYATSPGTFKGYSDPHLIADPDEPDRIWLSYSWLEVDTVEHPPGPDVFVATVENHLAKSDDGGATFDFVSELWGAYHAEDPEGTGVNGVIDSETASLAWMRQPGGQVKWYGAHLRYFLQPIFGYNPKYSTSWTIRVTAADTPGGLSSSSEAVLGVSTTHANYGSDVILDTLVGKPIEDCVFVNNPSLFANEDTLYLVFECLAFDGVNMNTERTTIQIIGTEPEGEPNTWSWRHVGEIINNNICTELGVTVLQQPDMALSKDGKILLTVTPAAPAPGETTPLHQGFIVLELEQLEPPVLARNCDGSLLVHAKMTNEGLGGCAYSSDSSTGIVCHSVQTDTEPRNLYVTEFHP